MIGQNGRKLYVGNLSFSATEADVRTHFEAVGPVATVRLCVDQATQRPRGFGFVEMVNAGDCQRAIDALNGRDHMGRKLVVAPAKPKN